MRNKLQNNYVLNRDGVYYYVRRIAKDVVKNHRCESTLLPNCFLK